MPFQGMYRCHDDDRNSLLGGLTAGHKLTASTSAMVSDSFPTDTAIP